MTYTLTATYDNPPSAVLTLTSDSAFSTTPRYRFKIYSDSAGTQLVTGSGWITLSEASTTITYTVASINSGTYYVTAESDDPETYISLQQVVLTDNTPKTATQSQWEDLATKVKAKADSSALPTNVSDLTNDANYQTGSDVSSAISTATQNMPVITMTNVDPGEGSALAADHYVAVYGGDPIILDYSTSEVNTGTKWIDGSAIYKKTINFGALPSSGNKNMAHSITNFSTLVDIKAMLYDTVSLRYKPLNLPQGNNTDWVVLEVNDTNVYAYVGSDFSNTTAYITLYYTKSSS